MQIRSMTPGDLELVLTMNQNALEGVGALDLSTLERLVALADRALVAVAADGSLAGFVITVAPGTEYWSGNYHWFSERLVDSFTYLDRIVVSPAHRRQGVASALYGEIEADVPVALEVYDDNAISLAFHGARGYQEVGRLEHGGHVNLMLVRSA